LFYEGGGVGVAGRRGKKGCGGLERRGEKKGGGEKGGGGGGGGGGVKKNA